MAIVFENKNIENTLIDDPIVEEIYTIVRYIKSNEFQHAYELLIRNSLSFENITSKTQTLKDIELVRFIDFVAKQKGIMWILKYL